MPASDFILHQKALFPRVSCYSKIACPACYKFQIVHQVLQFYYDTTTSFAAYGFIRGNQTLQYILKAPDGFAIKGSRKCFPVLLNGQLRKVCPLLGFLGITERMPVGDDRETVVVNGKREWLELLFPDV